MPGVTGVVVNLATQRATVAIELGTDLSAVQSAVERAGYGLVVPATGAGTGEPEALRDAEAAARAADTEDIRRRFYVALVFGAPAARARDVARRAGRGPSRRPGAGCSSRWRPPRVVFRAGRAVPRARVEGAARAQRRHAHARLARWRAGGVGVLLRRARRAARLPRTRHGFLPSRTSGLLRGRQRDHRSILLGNLLETGAKRRTSGAIGG